MLFDKFFNTPHDELLAKRHTAIDKVIKLIENPEVPFGADKKDLKFELLQKYGIPLLETPPS